jgi:hypothetical protein
LINTQLTDQLVPIVFSSYSRIIAKNALRFLFLTNHGPTSLPHISLDGNALRFSYRTNKIRKPKTRNASRFRRLALVQFNGWTTDYFRPQQHSLTLFTTP